MRSFAVSLQDKRITTDKIAHQLWKRLLDEGHIQISRPAPKEADKTETSLTT
jgi:hypothetical protein